MPQPEEHVVIIGNGIAGITAARHIRMFSRKRITVISGENEHFFARTALMYVYMGQMTWENIVPYEEWFWKENRIELKTAWVKEVDSYSKSIHFEDSSSLNYDKLILATGALPRLLGCLGEDLPGVQGLVTKQDLELLEENTRNCKKAVIVGGGLIGVELAEMLRSRGIKVSMLIREEAFWRNVLPIEDAQFISKYLKSHDIDLFVNTELEKIERDQNGRACAVKTKGGSEIPCDLVAISVGVRPNINFLKNSDIHTKVGILVNRYLQTNIEDVYAIGDCAEQKEPFKGRSKIESVWYTARMMGETVAQSICGNPFEYKPGHWFNSAKFFDVEYQTYGEVTADPPEVRQHLHWEHRTKKLAITIDFEKSTNIFRGINTFGIRMRHEVFDRWLSEGKKVDFVLDHLGEANFDPEFFDRHEKDIFKELKGCLENHTSAV